MNEDNQEMTLSALIDGTIDQLKDHIADKDLGYVNSLINVLKGTYITLEKNKDLLSKKIEGRELDTKNSAEDKLIVDTIQGVYAKMLKIEQLVLVINEEVQKRAIKD